MYFYLLPAALLALIVIACVAEASSAPTAADARDLEAFDALIDNINEEMRK
jgi:hypothetical protein